MFLDVKEIKEDTKKINHILYYGGDAVFDAYQAVKAADDAYKNVKEKLTTHFSPPANSHISIYKVKGLVQGQAEKFDEFVHRLRDLAKQCSFTSMDSEVRSQIVQGCLSERLKARAMEESTWTLDQVVAQGRLIESIEAQIKGMKPRAINQIIPNW